MKSVSRRFLLVAALLAALVASGDSVRGQSVTVAWDPSISDTVVGYRVYRDSLMLADTAGLSAAIPVVYDATHTIWVTAYDSQFNESVPSTALSVRVPGAPSPPPETCAPDGYGNGVDEDGDGLVDEGCLVPPTEQCGPDGAGNGIDEDRDGVVDEGCAPPPPTPAGCFTNGTLAPIDAMLTWSGKNSLADAVLLARQGEGWVLIVRQKVRNTTTLTLTCLGV